MKVAAIWWHVKKEGDEDARKIRERKEIGIKVAFFSFFYTKCSVGKYDGDES